MKALLFVALFAVETAAAVPMGVPEHFEKNGDVFTRRGRTDICLIDSSGITWQSAASSARMNFVDARPRPVLEGLGKLAGRVSYLTGSNPLNWRMGIESFTGLRYREIYPRIGLELHGVGEGLEYDFIVAPFADPSAIRIRFSGGAQVQLDKPGDLLVGAIRHHKPLAYQIVHHEGRAVSARFFLTADGDVHFAIGKYDHSAALVIDPVVTYDKIIGGTGFVSIVAMTVDAQGNIYIAGNTNATDLPVTAGALPHQPANYPVRPGLQIACQQMFVAKLNPDGADFAYLTYVDGTGNDFARGLAVDASGNAYLAGSTTSQDFPTTPGAIQEKLIVSTCTSSGLGTIVSYPCNDGFALKLNPAGSALVYSTLLGGSGDDELAGVRVDAQGNVWLAGYTTSPDFPTTAGAFQTKLNGMNDSFVAHLNTNGTALLESTLLGGSGTDQISALAIDPAGNAYVAGITTSSDFPTTAGAFQTAYTGAGDAFVAKFGPYSTAPIYATYYGSGSEIVSNIQADAGGNAYLGGSFPPGALSVGTGNPFVSPVTLAKIDPSGSSVVFGNSSLSGVSSLSVDSEGRVTAVGNASFNAPLSPNALSTCSSPLSPFLMRLEADGQTVSYGSYTSARGSQFRPVLAIAPGGPGGVAVPASFGAGLGGGTGDNRCIGQRISGDRGNDRETRFFSESAHGGYLRPRVHGVLRGRDRSR